MNKLRFLIAQGVILCLVVSPVIALMPENTVQAQEYEDLWVMFRHDPQHTGRSPYSGPEAPKEDWSFDFFVNDQPNVLCVSGGSGAAAMDVVSATMLVAKIGTMTAGMFDIVLADGSVDWFFIPIWINIRTISVVEPGYWVISSPAIGADGTNYVGFFDDRLYAVNADGSQKWSFTTGGDIYSSPVIGADGTIYVGSWDNKLYAINADGSQKWSFTTGGWVDSSPAIGADGTIYVGSWDNKLYAINADGSQKWSFTTEGEVVSSPATDADGTIYVGSGDNKLYAVNADGSQKWSFTTGGEVYSSPAIGADGTIYVGSNDGRFYAITGEYDLTISSAPGGSVTAPGEGTFTYDQGTVVNLVAEAEEGYRFVNWTGDVDTIADVNAASTTITMEGWYSLGPNFDKVEDPLDPGNGMPPEEKEPSDEEASDEGPFGGWCFIATAAYGTPMAEEIEILREFRDGYLSTNSIGQALLDRYYRITPPIAHFITEHPGLKPIVRAGLVPAVAISTAAVDTPPAEKAAIVGSLVLVSVAVGVWAARRRSRRPKCT
jgi:hypothetical protein